VVITRLNSDKILEQAFKISAYFDSTAKHPEWPGGETVQKLGQTA